MISISSNPVHRGAPAAKEALLPYIFDSEDPERCTWSDVGWSTKVLPAIDDDGSATVVRWKVWIVTHITLVIAFPNVDRDPKRTAVGKVRRNRGCSGQILDGRKQ
jgi:hypothetical protein